MHGVFPELEEWFNREFPGCFDYRLDRDYFDYIYSRQELAELKGKNFQPKRNHANKFKRTYKMCIRDSDCSIHSQEFDGYCWKYVLNDRSEVKCQLLDKERKPEEVSKHVSELVSYFERVPTQKEEVKSSLLFQIKVFTTVLKVEYKRGDKSREDMMCDVLFHLANKLQGPVSYTHLVWI